MTTRRRRRRRFFDLEKKAFRGRVSVESVTALATVKAGIDAVLAHACVARVHLEHRP